VRFFEAWGWLLFHVKREKERKSRTTQTDVEQHYKIGRNDVALKP